MIITYHELLSGVFVCTFTSWGESLWSRCRQLRWATQGVLLGFRGETFHSVWANECDLIWGHLRRWLSLGIPKALQLGHPTYNKTFGKLCNPHQSSNHFRYLHIYVWLYVYFFMHISYWKSGQCSREGFWRLRSLKEQVTRAPWFIICQHMSTIALGMKSPNGLCKVPATTTLTLLFNHVAGGILQALLSSQLVCYFQV